MRFSSILAVVAAVSLSTVSVQANDGTKAPSFTRPATNFSRIPNTTGFDKKFLHKAGYCNAYGCFGNVCTTPYGQCYTANGFFPINSGCECNGIGGTITG
jgi:hypothetical protein